MSEEYGISWILLPFPSARLNLTTYFLSRSGIKSMPGSPGGPGLQGRTGRRTEGVSGQDIASAGVSLES